MSAPDGLSTPASPEGEGTATGKAVLQKGEQGEWRLVGPWTLEGMGHPGPAGLAWPTPDGHGSIQVLDGSRLQAIDSAGAWSLQHWLRTHAATPALRAWPERDRRLMEQVLAGSSQPLTLPPRQGRLVVVGQWEPMRGTKPGH